MKLIPTLLMAFTLGACAAKHERIVNDGEKTIVSDKVLEMVLAAEDGLLDIREHENVRCRRIRIVGTHMVQRLCYTTEEEEEQARKTQAEYYAGFGANKCLDQSACGGN